MSEEAGDEAFTVYPRADHWDLKEQGLGAKTSDLCRKHGISDATFYNWKAK